jgi:hypothetical protein
MIRPNDVLYKHGDESLGLVRAEVILACFKKDAVPWS